MTIRPGLLARCLLTAVLLVHNRADGQTKPTADDRETVEDLHGGAGKPIPLPGEAPPITPGPFAPTYESLRAYRCPQWYQDAKLGLWAHWGPQGVAEIGDWYARDMYVEGSGVYKYHLAHYGHPSQFGFKDIIKLWKAEKFDPNHLISLYKAAGAKYFVSMAVHHDNFDLWNSKYHRWNAANMGPHKDIVGLWRAAALKQGLRFGVSEHMSPSFKWFSVAHQADKTGPYAGLPYDGNDPALYDLYGPKPEKIWSAGAELWQESGMSDAWKQEWYLRVRDLLDTYTPDYVYCDYGNVPFRHEVGWKMLADYYNSNIKHNNGKLDAVYTGKGEQERVYVRDFESGAAGDVQPEPWQMDWCINSFFYFKDLKSRPYRTADTVLRLLMDVVSKNGNLLLSIPQHPDGTIDEQEEKILADMAGWMKMNGEAIFGSRPFKVYGEGKSMVKDFRSNTLPYTAEDIRFTVHGDTLYAASLGIGDREVTIRTLASVSPLVGGDITDVRLLGHAGTLQWKRGPEGLVIQLPREKPNAIALVFKITGLTDLAWDGLIYASSNGSITLNASAAAVHGTGVHVVSSGGLSHTSSWMQPEDWLSWRVKVPHAGKYDLIAQSSAAAGESELRVEAGGASCIAKLPATENWDAYATQTIGQLDIPEAGAVTIQIHPVDATRWKPINLVSLTLKPVEH